MLNLHCLCACLVCPFSACNVPMFCRKITLSLWSSNVYILKFSMSMHLQFSLDVYVCDTHLCLSY